MNSTPRPTTTSSGRRVALVSQAGGYVGPALCLRLAAEEHDLVVQAPRRGLVGELTQLGAAVEVVEMPGERGPGSLHTAEGWAALVRGALERFGRLDAAAVFPPTSGPAGVHRGPFLAASVEALRGLYGYYDATFFALQALIGAMREVGVGGQIVVFTSDAGVRPEAGWSLYGAIRAGQTHLVRAVALEHAAEGICINVIGSKNAVFDGWPRMPAGVASDTQIELGDWAAPLLAETPLRRLGTMAELAEFTAVLLNGRNRFQTAQYFSFSGGWHAL